MSLYRTVLLVDDDYEDQEIFIEALKEVDPSVYCFCASDGEEALKLLNEDPIFKPDLVFMDINMPRLNGKDVLQEIRKKDPKRSIPVIMYSTFFGPSDIEETRAYGAAHHMVKSNNFVDLCAGLRRILTKKW